MDSKLNVLRELSKQANGKLTIDKYKSLKTETDPSVYQIKKEFDTWNKAKQQAGLSVSKYKVECTKQDCLEAIKRVATKLNKSPSKKEYNQYRLESEPSIKPIYNRFDCWKKAKKQAGLSLSKYAESKYTRKECLKSIKRVATKLDKSPTQREYKEHKLDSEPAMGTIISKFKTWNKAKQQSGVHVSSISKYYTKQECLKALERVATELDKSPTQREYNQYRLESEPCVDTLYRKFNDWNKAKRRCGLKQYHDNNGINYPYGSNWDRQRKKVLERDKYCQSCEMTIREHQKEYGQTLDVHHLYKLRKFFESLNSDEIRKLRQDDTPHWLRQEAEERTRKANHMSNLVAVCRECHSSLEKHDVKEQVNILNIDMPKFLPNDSN
jgi:hypothetical protein